MQAIETLNAWSQSWAGFMWTGLIETAVALAVVAIIWLLVRRRVSAHLGYCLFLLVLVKAVVPIQFTVPAWAAAVSPRVAVERAGAWLLAANPPAPPLDTARGGPPPLLLRDSPPDPHVPDDGEAPYVGGLVASRPPSMTTTAVLMLTWSTIALLLLVRLALVYRRTHVLMRRSDPVEPGTLPIDWDALRQSAGVRQRVQLVSNAAVASPAVWGLLRPRLVVPPDLARSFTPSQIRWILLHELAHVRRRDLWVVSFQKLVQIAYFFNPAVWLANWVIDQLREYACDDAALAAANAPRHDCGEGFLAIVDRPQYTRSPERLPAVDRTIRR